MKVTVIEKFKGKLFKTTYYFQNEEQEKKFISLCKNMNCIVIEHKKKACAS